MGGPFSRGLIAFGVVGIVLVAACSESGSTLPPRGDGNVGTSRQELFASEMTYMGAQLPAKKLILTFDDGPSGKRGDGRYQTREISSYLKGLGIKTTFFVLGSCIETVTDANLKKFVDNGCGAPSEDSLDTLRALVADGHLIANHTTTHRNQKGLAFSDTENDMKYTDDIIKQLVPWNRFFFRAPQGEWKDAYSASFNGANEPMRKYWGPIYWSAGGGPTTYGQNKTMAADWECWGGTNGGGTNRLSTNDCAERYMNEIHSFGNGIVLLHDQAYGNPDATSDAAVPGNTLRLVQKIVPQLIAEGYTFTTLDQDPELAAILPKCDTSCATCNGASASSCLSCAASKYLSGGVCAACASCGAGTFQATACTATTNTVCTACTSCGAGTFQTSACTATANATCTACAVCPAGQHQTAACTATTNTACANDEPTPTSDAGPDDAGPDDADDAGPTPPGPTPPTPTADSGTNGPSGGTDAGGTSDGAPSDGGGGGCATAPGSAPFSAAALGLSGLALLLQRRRRSRTARI